MPLAPDLLHEGISDAVQPMSAAHDDVVIDQLVHDGLDLFDADVAPHPPGIVGRRFCREQASCIALGSRNASEDGLGETA